MTNKEFDGAVDCLINRLLHNVTCEFAESLAEWMVEHDIDLTLAEDMLADTIKEMDARTVAKIAVKKAFAVNEAIVAGASTTIH
jgi:hypothetical protein